VEHAILVGIVGVAPVAALGGVGIGIRDYVESPITALTTATTTAQTPPE
jgi:Flp pilus assembly pilin Flp